jgi:hypothetical protein
MKVVCHSFNDIYNALDIQSYHLTDCHVYKFLVKGLNNEEIQIKINIYFTLLCPFTYFKQELCLNLRLIYLKNKEEKNTYTKHYQGRARLVQSVE